MSDRKNYNSIVFLTTLSVYLGFVLVGGVAPSVLAQAALTRNFDIKNEIVVEDDLDKKPDDGISEDVEIIEKFQIAEAIVKFVAELKKLESAGKFNAEDWNFSHKVVFEEFGTTNLAKKTSNVSNSLLEETIEQLISTAVPDYPSTVSEVVKNSENKNSRKTSFEIQSTANEFSLSFGFVKKSSEQARLAAEAFNKVFIDKKVELKNTVQLPVYENIKAISENNQVFIVTRLPRGSIDALLARKDAQ
jgi:hypothetical protein